MTAVDSQVDPRLGPVVDLAAAPAVWTQIGRSSDFERGGSVKRVTRWGEELVVYRATSGRLVVHNATCPHLGAHLGGGTVRGECLECPFHGWQFNPDGGVHYVPGARRVPGRARLDTYPTCEAGGIAFMYPRTIDALGGIDDLPALPPAILAELESSGSRLSVTRKRLRANLDEMGENSVDAAHFAFVHGPSVIRGGPFEVTIGDDNSLLVEGFLQVRIAEFNVPILFRHFSPLMSLATITTPTFETRLSVFAAQIAPKDVELIIVARSPRPVPVIGRLVQRFTLRGSIQQIDEDEPIWAEKQWLDRPILTDVDGPIGVYRRWLASFGLRADPTPAAASTGAAAGREGGR